MNLLPIRGVKGQAQALCRCSGCGAEAIVAAAHQHTPGRPGMPGRGTSIACEGQVITKLRGLGWSFAKNRLRCPACEAARKPHPVQPQELPAMAENVTQLRQPTPKQKREIISLLELVYDDDAKRYKGADTDVTVAETIGAGALFGWVAAIREEMFGPDGGNEEMESLRAECLASIERADRQAAEVSAVLARIVDERASVAAMLARLDRLHKAVGPKAARA